MNARLGLLTLFAIALAGAAFVLTSQLLPAASVLRNLPVVVGCAALALLSLFLYGWVSVGGRLSELSNKHAKELDSLTERIDALVTRKIDKATRQAQTLTERLASLQDEHPWVAAMTQNDIFPDSPSCRMALRTATLLVEQGRSSLAHEYLFAWVRPPGALEFSVDVNRRNRSLEGSVEDFLAVCLFCDEILNDEYLGTLVLRVGLSSTKSALRLGSLVLRRFVRHGMHDESVEIARTLRNRYYLSDWRLEFARWMPTFPKKSPYLVDILLSLGVFYSVNGEKGRFRRCLNAALRIIPDCDDTRDIACQLAQAEGAFYLGDRQSLFSVLERYQKETSPIVQADMLWLRRLLVAEPEITSRPAEEPVPAVKDPATEDSIRPIRRQPNAERTGQNAELGGRELVKEPQTDDDKER